MQGVITQIFTLFFEGLADEKKIIGKCFNLWFLVIWAGRNRGPIFAPLIGCFFVGLFRCGTFCCTDFRPYRHFALGRFAVGKFLCKTSVISSVPTRLVGYSASLRFCQFFTVENMWQFDYLTTIFLLYTFDVSWEKD